jgi:hypothetical protein
MSINLVLALSLESEALQSGCINVSGAAAFVSEDTSRDAAEMNDITCWKA